VFDVPSVMLGIPYDCQYVNIPVLSVEVWAMASIVVVPVLSK
jgi:hypothetical protein